MTVNQCDDRRMSRDFCVEVAAAALPLPVAEEDVPDEVGVDEAREIIEQERARLVARLRAAWDEGVIADPLLAELVEARAERERADARIRRLVAYGRAFTWPRPYPLARLAAAAGMSVSGVRTCYGPGDVDLVAGQVGHGPFRASTAAEVGDPAGAGEEEADRG